jgi:hypothetical protein
MASGKATAATSTRAVAGDRPRSPIARPSGTNRMTLRLVSPWWRYWESGASPMRPKSHRPGVQDWPLNPSASGVIVAASTAPTLMRRRNAIRLSVRRRRATPPTTASAITVVTASPGRNHGRTSARVVKGSPVQMDGWGAHRTSSCAASPSPGSRASGQFLPRGPPRHPGRTRRVSPLRAIR